MGGWHERFYGFESDKLHLQMQNAKKTWGYFDLNTNLVADLKVPRVVVVAG